MTELTNQMKKDIRAFMLFVEGAALRAEYHIDEPAIRSQMLTGYDRLRMQPLLAPLTEHV